MLGHVDTANNMQTFKIEEVERGHDSPEHISKYHNNLSALDVFIMSSIPIILDLYPFKRGTNIRSCVRATTIIKFQKAMSYVRHSKSYVRHSKSYVRHSKSYVRHSKSYVRHSKSYVRHSKSYVRHSKSYVRHSKSYVRHSKSYVRHSKSYVRHSKSYVRHR